MLQEFLEHGKEVREERARAAAAGEEPNFVPMVQQLGRRFADLSQSACRIRPPIGSITKKCRKRSKKASILSSA